MSFVVLSAIVTACGNSGQSTYSYQSGYTSAASLNANAYLPSDQQCSFSPNITGSTNSVSYRACRDQQQAGGVQLYPTDSTSKTVCVVPALNGKVSQSYYKCGTVDGAGSALTFGSLTYNGIYVVPAQSLNTFFQCSQTQAGVQTCTATYGVAISYGTL